MIGETNYSLYLYFIYYSFNLVNNYPVFFVVVLVDLCDIKKKY